MIEAQFVSFFIVLLVAVIFSALFSKLHLPWAVALIVGGILVGPQALGWFNPNETITFLGEIGMIFLMFMAGLEMRFENLRKDAREISWIAFLNGLIPFAVGFLIATSLGLGTTVALLIGVIFISSSVAVVVPTLSENKMLGTRLGNTIIGSTMLQDIASLILLSVLFQTTSELTSLPLPLFYIILVAFLIALRKLIPLIEIFFSGHKSIGQELRSIFVVLIGVVLVFELLGLHPIIAGFFAGLALADTLRSSAIKDKLGAISYGLFIPIFFVVIGANTDIGVFGSIATAGVLVGLMVFGSILSKIVSGWLAAKAVRFSNYECNLIAVTSVPQLSTTLAVAFSASLLGLISAEIVTALVILSIVTTLIAPLLTNILIEGQHTN